MADGVVSFVLKAIGNSVILEPGTFPHGTRELGKELEAELRQLQCFLKDADARAVDDDIISMGVSLIRDIAYDTEDLLDRYAFEVGSRRNGGFVGAMNRSVCLWNGWYFRRKVGSEMQELKTMIRDLNHELQTYGITAEMEEGGLSSSWQQLSRRTHSFVVEEDIVGLERDVDQLVHYLVSEDGHRAVSICGMGGSGKTTLARKVYTHPTVRRYFAGFAWICFSQEWQTRDIFEGVIMQLVPDKGATIRSLTEEEEEEDLARLIYTVQKQKRCLVVLDDIWSIEAWDCIRYAFPTEHRGSKILVTSRLMDLVHRIDPIGLLYVTRRLSDEESWELFQRMALQGTDVEGDMKKDIETVGRGMVRLCGGLPLALVVLAGNLSGKSSLKEWETMYEKILRFFSRDSLSGQGAVFWILTLSYNDLPPQLKLCFLYLGSFPEDTDIKAETLYQLWIAEGLVENPGEEESVMDLAESYLGELAYRRMVQVQTSDEPKIRRFESCRLHDMIRDFCLSKAREENFFKYISSEEAEVEQFDSITTPLTYELRRLVINSYDKNIHRNFSKKKEMTKHLRTLRFIVPNASVGREPMTIGFQFNNTEMLRVLSIEAFRPIDVWKLPKAIGKLIHLKYLSLKDSYIFTLPSSLTNLKHLQTLDLRVFKLARLPNILRKMVGLRYLYLPSFDKLGRLPNKIRLDGLSKLEILENFSDQMCDINDLLELANLQVLAVHCFELENLATITAHACSNNRLKHVSISTDCDFRSNMEKGLTILQQSLFGNKIHCFRSEGAVPKFPERESPISSSLVQLSMNLLGLKENNVMGTLGMLENLRTLFLWRFDGKEMTFHARGFPQLRTLKLFSFVNLKKWVVEETSMRNLRTLSIWGFTVLETIPDGLQYITTLKELDIRHMPEKFKARIGTQDGGRGEDFYKIRHVPSVLWS